ncbi:MAG: DUF4912 domain-containing protein [Candidatus Aureabacteria bacterium]|nr:DUF4912 domain-containing protein [Candidatus Auribacterota bacterium]
MAKKFNIKGYAKMKKRELIDSLSQKEEKASGSEKQVSQVQVQEMEKDSAHGMKDENFTSTSSIYNGQEQICESKYAVSYHKRPSFSEEHFVFPGHYGKDNIVLLVRDPYWVYSYWNLTEEIFRNLRRDYGDEAINNSRLTLRVKEVTGTHPDSPNESYDIFPPIGTTNWYINVNRSNASYCVEIGLLLSNNQFILIARSNIVHVPHFGPSDVIDEKWTSLIDFEKIYALSGGFDVGKSSGELRKEMVKRLEQALFSGASGAVSSFGKKKQITGKKGKSFFLVVNTELIVYGQTVPTATLTIQGKEHKLNPDGTFSIRFALPEGVHEIPVTSVSEDREDTITITPVVTKETR